MADATMQAMVLRQAAAGRLEVADLPLPQPGHGQIRVKVSACGVCRTDLHVVDGDLPDPKLPLIPGHEIVGRVDAQGAGVKGFVHGQRVGIPWLASPAAPATTARKATRISAPARATPASRSTAAMPPIAWPTRASASRCRPATAIPRQRRCSAPV